MSAATRRVIVRAVILLTGVALAAPLQAQRALPTAGKVTAATKAAEPAVLKALIAARWRLARARATLPAVQVVHHEHLETQNFVQYAFEGGALRLCVSPGRDGGDVFALLVDTRNTQYGAFTRLASAAGYTMHQRGPYVVVLPLRPVSQRTFDELKRRVWARDELSKLLGAASNAWHVHGAGYFGLTYVAAGLAFMGDAPEFKYQLFAPQIEAEWETTHDIGRAPITLLAPVDYPKLRRDNRDGFASELLRQREQIDQALAGGNWSTDGRFVAGHVNFLGMASTDELLIGQAGQPERRYPAPRYVDVDNILWLDARTIVFRTFEADDDFYTMNALTGAQKLVATAPGPPGVNNLDTPDFGVSAPGVFWYRTADGERHDVRVGPDPPR